MPYLIHVSILLAGFFLLYQLLLRKETFFQLNRWALIACLGLSFLLPLFTIPANWSLRTVSIEAAPTFAPIAPSSTSNPAPNIIALPEFQALAEAPIAVLPAQAIDVPSPSPILVPDIAISSIHSWSWDTALPLMYGLGVLGVGIYWLIQLLSLGSIIFRHPAFRIDGYQIVEVDQDIAPFSFLQYIVINPNKYDDETYQQIIQHERIHLRQGHSFDMILVELLVIILWFHPCAWLYRKAVKHNLEFLTDETMLQQGTSSISYQLNLVKVAAPSASMILVNNYSQSILKKRISMMNAHRSSPLAAWKYGSLLLLIICSVLSLNAVETETPTPPIIDEEVPMSYATPPTVPNPVTLAVVEAEQPEQPESAEPLSTTEMEGNWKAEFRGDRLCFKLSNDSFWNEWNYQECIDRDAYPELAPNSKGPYYVRNEVGELTVNGSFSSQKGSGTFSFSSNPDYVRYVARNGKVELSEEKAFLLFLAEADKDELVYLLNNGIVNFDIDQAVHAVRHGHGEDAAWLIKRVGQANYASFDSGQLLHASMHGRAEDLADLVTRAKGLKQVRFDGGQLLHAAMHDHADDLANVASRLQYMNYTPFDGGQLLHAVMHDHGEDLVDLTKALQDANYTQFDGGQILHAVMHDRGDDLAVLVQAMQRIDYVQFDNGQLLHACMNGKSGKLADMVRDINQYDFVQFDNGQLLHACMNNKDRKLVQIVSDLDKAGITDYDSGQILHAVMNNQEDKLLREGTRSGRVY